MYTVVLYFWNISFFNKRPAVQNFLNKALTWQIYFCGFCLWFHNWIFYFKNYVSRCTHLEGFWNYKRFTYEAEFGLLIFPSGYITNYYKSKLCKYSKSNHSYISTTNRNIQQYSVCGTFLWDILSQIFTNSPLCRYNKYNHPYSRGLTLWFLLIVLSSVGIINYFEQKL